MRPSSLLAAICFTTVVIPATEVHAVDGVVEIDQSKALAGGITSGDGPGFPVTIGSNGSYRLTSNLVVDENTTAISVLSGIKDVTIDLNGFSILGPVTCSGTPIACSPVGSGYGIHAPFADSRVRITNGHVRGMGRSGIVIARGEIDDVEAVYNSNWGISAAGGGVILTDSIAEYNAGGGIFVGTASQVRGCVAAYNGGAGISATASLVIGNVTHSNRWGIYTSASSVLDNQVRANTQSGLHVASGSGVTAYGRNLLSGNGTDLVTDGAAVSQGGNVCGWSTC